MKSGNPSQSELQIKSDLIRSMAIEEGFLLVAFAKAEQMNPEREKLKQWLDLGYHGSMGYMENHFDKRTDPTKLVPGTKSIICLAYNYHTDVRQSDPDAPRISTYAYGRDYHKVVKSKMKKLAKRISQEFGSFEHRSFVDSAPVLERDWARRSGLGWAGKNTMIINPVKGSRFFLSEMLVDFELVYDKPIKDYCGTCTRCIDACPTDAIFEEGYKMDASRCISYLTIELKDAEIPDEFKGKMENWVFGCDICQDVCPWNRFSKQHEESDFTASDKLLAMSKEDWTELDQESFDELFFGTPVKRTGFEGLKRNIRFLDEKKA